MLTKYYSGDQIKKNWMGRARNMQGEKRSLYGILVGKNEGKRKLGRLWRR
jgi:hypothetical protein